MKIIFAIVFLVLAFQVAAEQQGTILGAAHRRNAGGGTVAISYLGNYYTNATQSSYTFPGLNTGAAAANRIIWVTLTVRDTGAGDMASSLTVDGSAATLVISTNNTSGGNSSQAYLWQVALPSGTSGDVVVTFPGTVLRCRIGIYRVTGQSGVNFDADIVSGTSLSMSVNGSTSGALIACAITSAATSFTWSGVDEDFDVSANTSTMTAGSDATPLSGANTITPTAVASASMAAVAAAITP